MKRGRKSASISSQRKTSSGTRARGARVGKETAGRKCTGDPSVLVFELRADEPSFVFVFVFSSRQKNPSRD